MVAGAITTRWEGGSTNTLALMIAEIGFILLDLNVRHFHLMAVMLQTYLPLDYDYSI